MNVLAPLFQQKNYYDRESGLLNKAGFLLKARKFLSLSAGRSYVAIEFDIDKLNELTNRYGIKKSNEFIASIESAMRTCQYKCYFLTKVDSSRFLLLAEKHHELITEINQLLATVVEKLHLENCVGVVQFNFGAYEIVNAQEDIQGIIEKVNIANRKARKNVFANIVWYDKGLEQAIQQEKYYNEHLLTGIENEEFKMHLQLQMHLHQEQRFAAESLIRWVMPNGRVVYPASFIPQFEKNGMIIHLDYHVLHCICKYLDELRINKKKLFRISINLSQETLRQKDFIERFVAIVDGYNIPHEYIGIEIQELCFVDGESMTLDHIKELCQAGFVIAMDAFASGYSSLCLLPELPVQIIKLDRKLLRANDSNGKMKVVIESIITLAHNLGIQVICEGAEHQKDIDFLKELECDCAQGYYIMKPLAQEEFIPHLIESEDQIISKIFKN